MRRRKEKESISSMKIYEDHCPYLYCTYEGRKMDMIQQ